MLVNTSVAIPFTDGVLLLLIWKKNFILFDANVVQSLHISKSSDLKSCCGIVCICTSFQTRFSYNEKMNVLLLSPIFKLIN